MPTSPPSTRLGPTQKVSLAQAAVLLGVADRTLRRTAEAIRGGTPPKKSDPWQLAVAKLFVDAEGANVDVTLSAIFQALRMPTPSTPIAISPLPRPPAPEKKLRKRSKSVKGSLPVLRDGETPEREQVEEAKKKFQELFHREEQKETSKVAWNEIKYLVDWLSDAGASVQGMLHGYSVQSIDVKKISRFSSFGDFLARGEPEDVWVFVFAHPDSRPVELFSATPTELRYGLIVPLRMVDWADRTKAILLRQQEAAQSEAEMHELMAGTPRAKKRRRKNASS